jgi:hypothetical protein
MGGTEHFNLASTLDAIWQALVALTCRIGFDLALHGICLAAVVLAVGLVLSAGKHRYGKPLVAVFKKMAIACAVLAVPGLICLLTSGNLPRVNSLELSSVGLLGFWALVTLHLCMEEMNFQLFQSRQTPRS